MPKLPPCYGIIPARYGSSRFEGKPLADILGRPMFGPVYQRVIQCPLPGQVAPATAHHRRFSERHLTLLPRAVRTVPYRLAAHRPVARPECRPARLEAPL